MTCKRSYHFTALSRLPLFNTSLLVLVFFTSGSALASTVPTFLPATTYTWDGGDPEVLTLVDMNADGSPDLLVSGSGAIGVLLGDGKGAFQEPSAYYLTGGQAASRPVVADVNGDGNPDLVVAEACAGWLGNCISGETLVGVLLGNGDGTLQPAVVYKTGGFSAAFSVAVADLNGDGKLDLVAADWRCTDSGPEGCVSVLLGNGDGTFQPAQVYASGGWNAQSLVLADVNGDNKLDILVTNGGGVSSSIGVLLGNGDGTFHSAVAYGSGGGFALDLVLADVNRDSRPDLLVTNVYSNTIGVLLGNGDGTFGTAVAYSSGGQGIVSFAVADLNNDGSLDLVLANCGAAFGFCPGNGSVGVLLGKGDGTFATAATYDVGAFPNSPEAIAVADLDGDGNPDVVVARFFSGLVGVLQGRGDGTFQPAVFYDSGIYRASGIYPAHMLSAQNVTGNGKPDLVLIGDDRTGRGEVGVLLNNTSIDTTPPLITISTTPKVLWPPNGNLVPVKISGRITDVGSGVNVNSATYAVKDEYGKIQPQGTITLGPNGAYSFAVLLQASRLGSDMDGRRYTLTVQAKDNAGNVGSNTAAVIVPHDRGN